MKSVFYLLILIAIGYGIYVYQNDGDFTLPFTEKEEVEPEAKKIFKVLKVSKRVFLGKTPKGDDYYKKYDREITYSYYPGDTLEERKDAKEIARKEGLELIARQSENDCEAFEKKYGSIIEALKYYKSCRKTLIDISAIKAKLDSQISNKIWSTKSTLGKALSSGKRLPSSKERSTEAFLKHLQKYLTDRKNSVRRKSGSRVESIRIENMGKQFQLFNDWYFSRFDELPKLRKQLQN